MKKGMSSVFILLIMSSVCFLLLVFIEVSSGYSARSISENICLLTARSVLSEFEPELYERYGIFALKNDQSILNYLTEDYLKADMKGPRRLIKLDVDYCNLDTSAYSALDTDLLSGQLAKTGALEATKVIFNEIDVKKAGEQLSSNDIPRPSEVKADISDFQDGLSSTDSAFKQASRLKRQLRESTTEDFNSEESASLIEKSFDLPSAICSCPERGSLIIGSGLFSIDGNSIAEDEYILSSVSNAVKRQKNSQIGLECEYILFGGQSDRINEQRCKSSIFALRSALNSIDIVSDSNEMARISAEASASFGLIPYPIAVAALIAIKAGIKAKADVGELFAGGKVPISCVKALEGKYEDYLRILLLQLPRKEKLLRLMDVIQINLKAGGNDFRFSEYAYGFSMEVSFSKKRHVPGLSGYRNGIVVQEHAYK